MSYVTNGAADGEDGESLARENAMSRLIKLIGNLGAADCQGFVFFAVAGAKSTERHKRGLGSQKTNK